MNVSELAEKIHARIMTEETGSSREVLSGYSCDLLSWVMAHGSEGMAWVTVQTHMNVIAVAALHDMACVILPENISMGEEQIKKAQEENISVLQAPMSAYEICGIMFREGISAHL